MTRLILAAVLGLAGPVLAQTGEEGGGTVDSRDATFLQSVEDMDVVTADGDKIGEIEEILVDNTGVPAGFLLEVGGFLGLGDSDVSVPLDALAWDGTAYVSKMTLEQLEALAPFDE
ncbi:PRC-barrel domain-containing protein [Marivita sp.]|uniref:PRC-barrel domain-containing protein n=1 Tax=Marivita sp. TaxID=2003365 RepID=UPI0025C1794A|nr:PRC-barrel domain-containing protein [Marivita sp.]